MKDYQRGMRFSSIARGILASWQDHMASSQIRPPARSGHRRIRVLNAGVRFLREAGLILLAAIVAGAVSHYFRSGDAGDPAPVAVSDTAVLSGPKMIDIQTAATWFDNNSAVFIDVRNKYDYAAGHMPGAITLDAKDPDAWMMDVYHSLPQDGWVVTYGDDDSEADARLLADRLSEMGFHHVYYLADGWQQWLAQGLPINDTINLKSDF